MFGGGGGGGGGGHTQNDRDQFHQMFCNVFQCKYHWITKLKFVQRNSFDKTGVCVQNVRVWFLITHLQHTKVMKNTILTYFKNATLG